MAYHLMTGSFPIDQAAVRERYWREYAKDLPFEIPEGNAKYLNMQDWLMLRIGYNHPEMLTDKGREDVKAIKRRLLGTTIEGKAL